MFVPDIFDRRRNRPSTSQSPSLGAGPSSSEPDLRRVVEIVPKSAGYVSNLFELYYMKYIEYIHQHFYRGFEVEPSEFILQVSKEAYKSRMSGCWPQWDNFPTHIKNAIWADLMVSTTL